MEKQQYTNEVITSAACSKVTQFGRFQNAHTYTEYVNVMVEQSLHRLGQALRDPAGSDS
jgi:hypothetical protein